MIEAIDNYIDNLELSSVDEQRQAILQPLVDYIAEKHSKNDAIRLNFICTHNSRRSVLGQVWAQTLAAYFMVKNVSTYSGGTETTAVYQSILTTLDSTGFDVSRLSEGKNPVLAIKYEYNEPACIAFSKKHSDKFNPSSAFAAIMTCSHADENCPFIPGAEKRIPITFEDPKVSDGTAQELDKYEERSRQIATEMKYVFTQAMQE